MTFHVNIKPTSQRYNVGQVMKSSSLTAFTTKVTMISIGNIGHNLFLKTTAQDQISAQILFEIKQGLMYLSAT